MVTSAFKSMNAEREIEYFSWFGLQPIYPGADELCRYHSDGVREHGDKDKATKY
jgi:hypothetical protein